MAAEAAVTVSPTELRFRFELRKQIPVTLTVNNGKDVAVAFKVKTTSPKKYIVRPSTGVVKAGASVDVQVIMQSQKEYPPDLNNCKDKFLVQTVPLPSDFVVAGEKPEAPPDLFDKSNADNITDIKLKVALVAPPAPPSPVPEGDELDSSDLSVGRSAGPKSVDEAKYRSTLDDLAAATKEVNTLKDQIKKLMDEKVSLNDKIGELEMRAEGKPFTPSAAADGVSKTSAPPMGFTLLHLILVAILCFLIGHYT